MHEHVRRHARLWGAAGLAGGLVAAAIVLPGGAAADRGGSLADSYDAASASRVDAAVASGRLDESVPHSHPGGAGGGIAEGIGAAFSGDGHGHVHNDPATKNLVSRGGVSDPDAQDPTTAAERRASRSAVAQGRRTPDPTLRTVPVRSPRRLRPENIWAMAGGCYRVGRTPIRFQATDLGTYLLYTADRTFLGADGPEAEPSDGTVWRASRRGGRYRFWLTDGSGTWLRTSGGELTGGSAPQRFALRRTSGCRGYPEVGVNVSGRPHAGTTSFEEVRGWADLHTHGMAFEFLGGDAHCGKPWDRFGAPSALVDCPDHTLTDGKGAALEAFLSGEPSHDPVGWPTFADWPAPNSLTHEGTYWKWMERTWRGGLRLFTNLLVENGQLCKLYPIKHNSCDEMTSVRLQAHDMYAFQRYIDAQYGGPGKGWYRIVKSPAQARRVINAGKLAVVMGIETSVPFGCSFTTAPGGDIPSCDVDAIDAQLDEMYGLGVRQMELVNKFDNALSGVTGDSGETGVLVNSANFLETGSFWQMQHCEPEDGESADKTQYAAPDVSAGQQDALFGAIAQVSGLVNLPALPLYPTPQHCNSRGLTELGEHLLARMMDKHMLIDPDHMSVKARNTLLDVLEAADYPGVLSSHSWATPDAYPRIYEAGGAIAPYAGDSTGFVDKWRRHLGWADDRYFYGMGYGADINGLGAQGDPRGADAPDPVTYPFTGINGITVKQQHSGKRVYDINVDGVAHYGLYPDWIEDLRRVADAQNGDGDAIVEDMSRGPEAYLQTWERATGIAPDPCRNPELRRNAGAFQRTVKRGMWVGQVLRAVGQPFTRIDREFAYCAQRPGRANQRMTVTFGRGGRVVGVRRGA